MTVKQEILNKLAEIETLLAEASCDGEQLAELDCYAEVSGAVTTLVEAVDYYVD